MSLRAEESGKADGREAASEGPSSCTRCMQGGGRHGLKKDQVRQTTATRLEQAYNAGETTQVPTGRVIGVRGRVRRKISYNGFPLSFVPAGPAPR